VEDLQGLVNLDYLPRMPRNKAIGIGCIGAGFIMADCHLVAYRKAGFNPVAIASRSPARAREAAARHGIPRVYEDYRQLLDDPAVEVVDVAVPPDQQLSIVRELAKHSGYIRGVLVQEPVACSLAEARKIVCLCGEAEIMLAVNQNMRYDQSIRACRCVLDRGDLGGPVLATIEMRAIPHWLAWHERLGFRGNDGPASLRFGRAE
jgi:predicted dehydrogenase